MAGPAIHRFWNRILGGIGSRGLRIILALFLMKGLGRVFFVSCAGRQIPNSGTGEQHFDYSKARFLERLVGI